MPKQVVGSGVRQPELTVCLLKVTAARRDLAAPKTKEAGEKKAQRSSKTRCASPQNNVQKRLRRHRHRRQRFRRHLATGRPAQAADDLLSLFE